MTGLSLLLIGKYSSAKYLLVDIRDDVDDGFGTINENGLYLSDSAKVVKGYFIRSGFGRTCIEAGYVPLANEQECREAARALDTHFVRSENNAYHPPGCYFIYRYGSTYWNLHKTGQTHNDASEICRD